MALFDSLFESYSRFVVSKGKYLLAAWVLLIVALSPYTITLGHIISYSINVPSSDNESSTAQNLISTRFRGYEAANTTAFLILEGQVVSAGFYQRFSQLNTTLYAKLGSAGLNSTGSVYGLERSLLLGFIGGAAGALNATQSLINSTSKGLQGLAQSLTNQSRSLQELSDNVSSLASYMWNLTVLVENISATSHGIQQNLTTLNTGLYKLQDKVIQVVAQVENLTSQINTTNAQLNILRARVNQTLRVIYGIPQLYVDLWLQAASQSNYAQPTATIDQQANSAIYELNNFAQNPTAKLYYGLFYAAWFQITQNQPAATVAQNIYMYADQAVSAAVNQLVVATGLSGDQAAFLTLLVQYFNISDFGSPTLIDQFTLSYATQGLSPQEAAFVEACFELGPQPTKQQVDQLALYYATQGLSPEQADFVKQAFYGVQEQGLGGFVTSYFAQQINRSDPNISLQLQKLNTTLTQLVQYAYSLGNPPNQTLLVDYTAKIVSGALPKTLDATLQHRFDTSPQLFVERVLGLGYPPTNSSIESYVVSLFSGGGNLTFFEQVYRLGPRPTHQQCVALAINITLGALAPSAKQNITQSFGVAPHTYFEAVASLGYPPSPQALENLTVTLFQRYLEEARPGFGANITKNYGLSPQAFLTHVYEAGFPPQEQSLTLNLTYTLLVHSEEDQPLLKYNNSAVNLMLPLLFNNTNRAQLANRLMLQNSLFDLPVRPTDGLLYRFVNTGLNTTVVTLSFSYPPNSTTLREFENTAASFNTSSFRVYYTSSQIIGDGLKKVVTESELYSVPFGLAAAVIITAIFFSSPVAALLPLLVFGVGAAVGFGLIHLYLGYYEHTTLSYISPVIILILSLGLVTDYSVLILNRFREELGRGEREALARSTRWAGEAVFTSGLTVILSYVVLSAAHIPLFSDVGTANALIVVSILAASLTFLPPLLAILGKRVFWPKKSFQNRPSRLAAATRKAMQRPKTVLAAMLLVTAVAAAVAATLPVNIDFLALTPAGPGKTGLDQITHNYGGNTLIPTYVVVGLPAKLSGGANLFNVSEMEALANLTHTIRGSEGVVAVYGPTSPYNYSIPYSEINRYGATARAQYASAILNYVSTDNRTVYFEVVFAGDPFGNSVLGDAVALKHTLHEVAPKGYQVYVGGGSLDAQAALSYVFEVLPKIVVILVSAIYVVLLLQLRSAFTPLRLIATVLSGIAWTLLFGWIIFYRIGGTSVFVFAPLFLVTTMLGVGVDYDIFMMTRVREEARKGLEDEQAIIRTAETTAGVVTTLGLILSSVFLGLTLTGIALVQQIGLSLTIGILLDTFVVWLIYVPAIMVLAKRLNWWPSDPRKEPIHEQPTSHR